MRQRVEAGIQPWVHLWVAVARMYRGMHHPTDIVGGMVLAGMWVTATWWLIRPNNDLTGDAASVSEGVAQKAHDLAAVR